jgi:hypothetical protein
MVPPAVIPQKGYNRAVQTMKRALGLAIQVRVLCLGLAGLAAGCGSSGGGSTVISTQPLAGKIGGQPWTFMTGETDSSLSTASEYWVDAYAESFTPCTGSSSTGGNRIIMSLPMTIGNYPLSLQFNQTFYIAAGNDNLAATSGEIDITDISATTITGGAKFAYNADNSVDGQFAVSICP